MRSTRLLAASAALSVLVVGPLANGIAAAADPVDGVGTGTISSTLLSVELGADGDLLSVRVLGDDSVSTIDPVKGTPISSATLSPLVVNSATVPALAAASPTFSTSSEGAEDRKSAEPALPATAAFRGQVKAVASSIVDAAGARSGLAATATNLNVAGGLVKLPSGAVKLATDAATGEATGSQSITIPEVRVLDLTSVLEGLGLTLADLPLDDLLDLLDPLGVDIPNLADPEAVVAALNETIDVLQDETGQLTAPVCAEVDGLLGTLDGTLGGIVGELEGTVDETIDTVTNPVAPVLDPVTDPVAPVTDPVTAPVAPVVGVLSAAGLLTEINCSTLTKTAEELLDDVQDTLAGLISALLVELEDISLLTATNVNIGLVATATDTVESSTADVTASIGSVKVGELAVPGITDLDLTAPLATLDQAAATVQTAVGDVLAVVNASLEDLVKVELLKIEELISADGGYTNAAATLTALRATLTPPDVLGAALLDLGEPVSDLVDTLGGTVPAISPLMVQLEAALGGLEALSAPSVVTVGQLSTSAAFRPVAAAQTPGTPDGATPDDATPTGTLPRTGTDAAIPAMLGAGLAGLALAIRRLLRSANIAA